MCDMLDHEGLAIELQAMRRQAALTQVQLAQRMGTSQSLVARVEGARVAPSLAFIDRWARATGHTLRLTLGADPDAALSPSERAELVRGLFGANHFDPWERRPSAVEARTLDRAGIPRPRRSRA
jgi:transcriptional regulator with XRE-family HTH domain